MVVFRENSNKTSNLTRTNQNKFKAVTCTNYADASSTTRAYCKCNPNLNTHTKHCNIYNTSIAQCVPNCYTTILQPNICTRLERLSLAQRALRYHIILRKLCLE